jgi:hypothetical protein
MCLCTPTGRTDEPNTNVGAILLDCEIEGGMFSPEKLGSWVGAGPTTNLKAPLSTLDNNHNLPTYSSTIEECEWVISTTTPWRKQKQFKELRSILLHSLRII